MIHKISTVFLSQECCRDDISESTQKTIVLYIKAKCKGPQDPTGANNTCVIVFELIFFNDPGAGLLTALRISSRPLLKKEDRKLSMKKSFIQL